MNQAGFPLFLVSGSVYKRMKLVFSLWGFSFSFWLSFITGYDTIQNVTVYFLAIFIKKERKGEKKTELQVM